MLGRGCEARGRVKGGSCEQCQTPVRKVRQGT